MKLAQFLEKSEEILVDHDEAKERLHSRSAGAAPGGILFGVLGHPDAVAPAPTLASLPGPTHRQLLQRYADAATAKRAEIINQNRIRLFSIVFAYYRPGPAFLPWHTLPAGGLTAKVAPGGETWEKRLGALPGGLQAFDTRLAALARHCPRLDTYEGVATGSGFILEDGSVVTARHVVKEPGHLFGNPFQPANVRYHQINVATPVEPGISAAALINRDEHALDMARLEQAPNWRATLAASALAAEFGVLSGLQLQTEPLTEVELKGRPVAVIAHPVFGNAGGDPADIQVVYGDAPLKLKRFMPGLLDGEHPIASDRGQSFLWHDCSTLGGASGGCLIDLLTERVLGIHVGGNAALANRAVPIWTVPGLPSVGVSSSGL